MAPIHLHFELLGWSEILSRAKILVDWFARRNGWSWFGIGIKDEGLCVSFFVLARQGLALACRLVSMRRL